MPSRLTGFVCPTVSMVTTGHATGVEKTLLIPSDGSVNFCEKFVVRWGWGRF